MLAICRKCRCLDRDVIGLRIPADGHMPAHASTWCGPCIEERIERIHRELRIAAAQIAVLREEEHTQKGHLYD